MTLVEVMASLLILSVLLSSVLVTRSRMTRLSARSEAQLQAQQALDELLTNWQLEEKPIPLSGSGRMTELTWRSEVLRPAPLPKEEWKIVKVSMSRQIGGAEVELASVELLVGETDVNKKIRP